MLSKKDMNMLATIASFYGCEVKFDSKRSGGFWLGESIVVGTSSNTGDVISTFCHELAHFINWKTGKFPIYHNPNNFEHMDEIFPHYSKRVRYSLQAEIFTDKQGKKLCKEWFPRIKYRTTYKNTKACYEFLNGYYLKF